MRFGGEDISRLTMQQLRGCEGARVRGVYRRWSRETGVKWERREFDSDDFDPSSQINKALSTARRPLVSCAIRSMIDRLRISSRITWRTLDPISLGFSAVTLKSTGIETSAL